MMFDTMSEDVKIVLAAIMLVTFSNSICPPISLASYAIVTQVSIEYDYDVLTLERVLH